NVGARTARDDVSFDEIANVVVEETELLARQRAQIGRQLPEHRASEPNRLEDLPESKHEQRGQHAPQRDIAAVIARQRMEHTGPGPDRAGYRTLPAEVVGKDGEADDGE